MSTEQMNALPGNTTGHVRKLPVTWGYRRWFSPGTPVSSSTWHVINAHAFSAGIKCRHCTKNNSEFLFII